MSWFDNQEKSQGSSSTIKNNSGLKTIEIKLPGGTDFVRINKNQCKRIYADDMGGALLIVIDEAAELLMMSGTDKEEDSLRKECIMIIQSITQLGRAAGIHMIVCTQRNDAKIIPGVIQSNCQFRMVCGRLGSVASMMALGNTLGCTINGKQKGAGAIASNGSIDMLQYYFAPHSWIVDWYKKRGMDDKGFSPEDLEIENDTTHIEILNGEEEVEFNDDKMEINFAGVHGEVDKSRDQKFEEV